MKPRVSVVTGSRAEFGLLKDTISRISNSSCLELELIVTGSHLSKAFGITGSEIPYSDFKSIVEIDLDLNSDSETELARATGVLIHRLAENYSKNQPSLTLVLGDRYEMLGVAVACAILGIPVGHIHGGEITTGSKDDMYRHAITKLAALHFVANSEFKLRLTRMGEDPNRVFVVGGLGVDSINHLEKLSRQEIEAKLGIKLGPEYALVTFHPDSVNPKESLGQLEELMKAIESFPNIQFIVTGANADYLGQALNERLREKSEKVPGFIFFESLGHRVYLSLLAGAKFVLGNSSSGILEAPSFKIPTINIGKRQDGRPRASNVVDVDVTENSIINGVLHATSEDFLRSIKDVKNPYGDPGASKRISEILEILDYSQLLPKKLFLKNDEGL